VAEIMPLLVDDDVLGTESLATHRRPLAEAPRGCEIFQQKDDGAIKVVPQP
jgi:threonine dehydrogenase-like Zn-dependent dehydrogenase